jgi:hypothetical protein
MRSFGKPRQTASLPYHFLGRELKFVWRAISATITGAFIVQRAAPVATAPGAASKMNGGAKKAEDFL